MNNTESILLSFKWMDEWKWGGPQSSIILITQQEVRSMKKETTLFEILLYIFNLCIRQ